MSNLVDSLFGGTSKKAIRSQERQNDQTRDFIGQYNQQARNDAMGMFPYAADARRQGVQGALDIFGQTIPQQLSTFQQGNVGAQNALLAGMPQYQNAILGMPVDYSAMQPQTLSYNAGFSQQQLPEPVNFAPSTDPFSQSSGQNPFNATGMGWQPGVGSILGGRFFNRQIP